MRLILGGAAPAAPAAASAIFVGALLSLVLAVGLGFPLLGVTVLAALVGVLVVAHRWLLRWHNLLALLLIVILFVPIRRFVLPGDLPFQLEPYRVVVALLIVCWGSSLLIDNRVRLRATGMAGPLVLIAFAALGSVVLNLDRIASLGVESNVKKTVTFLASFILLFFFVVSVMRTTDQVRRLMQLLVAGGAVVAVMAVIESRTGTNPFNDLDRIFPFLRENFVLEAPNRSGRLRANGPAEHPIALAAALAMLVPVGFALWQSTRQRRWLFLTVVITTGVFATVSRTGILMLAAAALVVAWLRWSDVKRFWPLVLPLVVAIHFVLPGTLGAIRYSFFPKGGLIEEQRGYKDSGRVGDIRPTLQQASNTPLFGQGIGTRITTYNRATGQRPNARILDDQWLATLLETGMVGLVGWVWFFVRFIRRAGAEAKRDRSERGWLLVALAAAVAAYAVGMLTFDAFSFVQVTFFLYIFVAFGVGLVGGHVKPAPSRQVGIRAAHAYARP